MARQATHTSPVAINGRPTGLNTRVICLNSHEHGRRAMMFVRDGD